MKKDIFIVGSKGIPAQYGGYETFVDNLVTKQVAKDIKYHVACMTFMYLILVVLKLFSMI